MQNSPFCYGLNNLRLANPFLLVFIILHFFWNESHLLKIKLFVKSKEEWKFLDQKIAFFYFLSKKPLKLFTYKDNLIAS